MVLAKGLDLNTQNEENHQRNEELDPGLSIANTIPPPRILKPPKKLEESSEDKTERLRNVGKDKVKVQRPEHLHMAERPTAWMGGEGEKVEHPYLQKPKNKVRDSWIGSGMSQSMRDLTPRGSNHDYMNTSDTGLLSSTRRRQTSMVMEKNLDLSKQNEEKHQKNEKKELSPGLVSISAPKVWKPNTSAMDSRRTKAEQDSK